MAGSKLKRGPWTEPYDPMQVRISGPTMLVDRETKIRVGHEYYIPAALTGKYTGWWLALRILKKRIEFQQGHTGRIEKFKKADILVHLKRRNG